MNDADAAIELACSGCGAIVPLVEPDAFRCRAARVGDDVDHVLRVRVPRSDAGYRPQDTDPHPFVRYRRRLYVHHVALAAGMDDARYVELVRRLDAELARVAGCGLSRSPCSPSATLAAGLGPGPDRVWIKDETVLPGGSHKVRHLFGVLLFLEVLDALGLGQPRKTPLAIASCGNAALAAALLARAARRPLEVDVPPSAARSVVERLEALGARIVVCPRETGAPAGDPCYLRFQSALASGALPFCCQGPDNALTIEGGKTLVYELVSALRERGATLDHLVVQVGGGALASACVQALEELVDARVLPKLPRIHAVQTLGAAPLARALERVRSRATRDGLDSALNHAARHRSQYMWPWETEPHSIAEGILDDETYDWHAIVAGILRSDGSAPIVDEATLARANDLCRIMTGIDASHTGSAGLAGFLHLVERGHVRRGERVAVLVTGARR